MGVVDGVIGVLDTVCIATITVTLCLVISDLIMMRLCWGLGSVFVGSLVDPFRHVLNLVDDAIGTVDAI